MLFPGTPAATAAANVGQVQAGAPGVMIVDGELDELMKIVAEEETLTLNAQATAIVSEVEIQVYGGGNDQSVQQLMGNYTGSMQELGYM